MSRPFPTAAAATALALSIAAAAPLPAAAADAMRVVRDPATGELRAPNAAEAAAFEKAEAQLRGRSGKAQPPVEIRYPDGTIETKMGDDTMMYSVVTSAADGTLTMNCLPAREAKALVLKSSSKTRKAATKAEAKAEHAHP